MHIGIDVGGTNTDAVLMDGSTVVTSVKSPTTVDVTAGIITALAELGKAHPYEPSEIQAVMIGTTHFTNAVVEAHKLAPTAAVRLGLPAAAGIPPLSDWPDRLSSAIGNHVYPCHGGNEFDGRTISSLDADELAKVGEDLLEKGVRTASISSIFSPINNEMEQEAAALLAKQVPDLKVSLSHEIGRIGLLERENATIINASLLDIAHDITESFASALQTAGLSAPLFLSQNDGTLMGVDFVRRYPVMTFAAGPTNSMRGAALLSGLTDCVVVDVGGTTSDVGVLVGGFPRPATSEVDIGGVRTNFRMPDVTSVGIGGGSIVRTDSGLSVGPDSVGFRLSEAARVFGGDTLTATDIAVASGLIELGDRSKVADLDKSTVEEGIELIAERIAITADRMRTSAEPIPIVLAGGGSVLLPDRIPGFDKVVRPDHFPVANAIGAGIAQVGGEVDKIVAVGSQTRSSIIEQAKEEAAEKAVQAGATSDNVRIVEVDELPIAYLPGNSVRVRVKAVGDLDLRSTK